MEHHGRPPGAPSGPDDRGELRTPAQACLRGQHVRRRASRDPCADGRRGSPGPRGSASAAGTRGSSTDGGCSAGTCACSRGTPTTRHRRCTSAGGRVCAGLGTAVRRSPVTPEAGLCGRHAPTDSSQHNRGIATADGRAHPDRPWSTRTRRGGGRRAGATRRRSSSIVAGLWMGLLASPSLRVGRQGHDAWPTPRSTDRRIARSPARTAR